MFTPRTLSFLRSLKRNNDRAWFAAHREVVRVLRDVLPLVRFLNAAAALGTPALRSGRGRFRAAQGS